MRTGDSSKSRNIRLRITILCVVFFVRRRERKRKVDKLRQFACTRSERRVHIYPFNSTHFRLSHSFLFCYCLLSIVSFFFNFNFCCRFQANAPALKKRGRGGAEKNENKSNVMRPYITIACGSSTTTM